jgi:hypothetical protein
MQSRRLLLAVLVLVLVQVLVLVLVHCFLGLLSIW